MYKRQNYYFEIESDDEDYVDEITGETIKGLRKYGPSKAVSYTHLDVYKRQVQYRTQRISAIGTAVYEVICWIILTLGKKQNIVYNGMGNSKTIINMGGILTIDLSTLVKMSNTYGSNPADVLAGGGNTSVKDDTTLYVKGSGTQPVSYTHLDVYKRQD